MMDLFRKKNNNNLLGDVMLGEASISGKDYTDLI